MKNPGMAVWTAIVTLLMGAPAISQNGGGQDQGEGQAVVTMLPKHEGEVPASVANQDLSVKVNGKNAKVTKWAPFKRPRDKMELVLLIDDSARSSLGTQTESEVDRVRCWANRQLAASPFHSVLKGSSARGAFEVCSIKISVGVLWSSPCLNPSQSM